jgi:hypothetical protein
MFMAGERVKKRTPQEMMAAAKAQRQAPPGLAQLRPVVRMAAAPKARTRDERIALAMVNPIFQQFAKNRQVKARMSREGWQLNTVLG